MMPVPLYAVDGEYGFGEQACVKREIKCLRPKPALISAGFGRFSCFILEGYRANVVLIGIPHVPPFSILTISHDVFKSLNSKGLGFFYV